jgi:hypothetical protein
MLGILSISCHFFTTFTISPFDLTHDDSLTI